MTEQNIKYAGVKTAVRNGKTYAYHRKTQTRIEAEIGTPEFQAELDRLNGVPRPSDRAIPGTLHALIDAYRLSPEFTELAPRTRSDYDKVFAYLRPGAQRQLLDKLRTADILTIRDVAFRQKKRAFANYCVIVLRLLLKWGAVRDLVPTNAAAPVPKLRRPKGMPKANRPWAPLECEAVLDAASGGVKVIIALGMFAGMREGDCLRATHLNYTGTHLRWTQGKTGDPVEMPVAPPLKKILDAEIEAHRAMTPDGVEPIIRLATNLKGLPYTGDGFRTMLWKLLHRLEQENKVLPGLTFHGLRHTAGKMLADLGASPHEIAALLGHKTLAMATHYSDEVNRTKLTASAVARLHPRNEG